MNSGNKGIQNIGNTCYLNSVVQCLTHILFFHPVNKKLTHDFDSSKDTHGLVESWFDVNRNMWSNDTKTPLQIRGFVNSFIHTIRENKIYFENFQQNDAEEFITLLLDRIHEVLKKTLDTKGSSEADQSWYTSFHKDYSLIKEYFYSQSQVQTLCTRCNHKTTRYEPFMIYQLSIGDNIQSIEEAFHEDCRSESMDDYTCDKCKETSMCVHKRTYTRMSDLMIVQLKLYNSRGKINRHINYSDTLDLSKLTNKKTVYQLVGIVIHMGSLNSGHYVSICKNLVDHQWRLYNDSQVQTVSLEQATNQKPYLLFYKRDKS